MTRTISVRLDEPAMRALHKLEAKGRTRSEAIRLALIESADRGETLREESKRLAADPTDRAEIAEIQALMDELSEPW